jgi:putative sigma-54 modulation protein
MDIIRAANQKESASMQVELQARHFDLTEPIKDYVEKKVGRLDKYLPDIHATSVELERDVTRSQGEVYVAEITAWVDNAVLRAEEVNADVYTAIDEAGDKIFRQIEKYKGKRLNRWHGRAETAPSAEQEAFEADQPDGRAAAIERRKRFRVYAMTEDEAVEQIDLLGHDFFVFVNGETGEMNVLYRRKGGNLGLIEPTPA